uniref:Uncharacterized protein n=1 Tax=Molossus molossus TaxID=27622 RepID=A0A7J8JVS9_MOLMO|nr:hypothetical protein HJG59_007903 [Molossus molossus]
MHAADVQFLLLYNSSVYHYATLQTVLYKHSLIHVLVCTGLGAIFLGRSLIMFLQCYKKMSNCFPKWLCQFTSRVEEFFCVLVLSFSLLSSPPLLSAPYNITNASYRNTSYQIKIFFAKLMI